MSNAVALRTRLSDAIREYDEKAAALGHEIELFTQAGDRLKSAVTIMGQWGRESINVGSVYERELQHALLTSAWLALYNRLELKTLMSAKDKKRFEEGLSRPVEFTLDNIKATFGDYILDPRGNILRGLAEVFCGLDQSYKSHDKVKIGVQGLPKRIILGGFNSFYSSGINQIADILNALAVYQGKPAVDWVELRALEKNEYALKDAWVFKDKEEERRYPGRGVWLRKFANGNGHLFFDADTMRDINMALAEYYGEVLSDCYEEKPTERKAGTAVSKDLQYYPTPVETVNRIIGDLYIDKGDKVLEPSCGCGRILDGIKKAYPEAKLWGIEVDAERAAMAKAKGHNVYVGNFLEAVPEAKYDRVIMNPPFYGTHYAKHVRHALKFLKPGGTLTAILPITARLDHGLLDDLNGRWDDLPVGSFRESGTNINTTILTVRWKD